MRRVIAALLSFAVIAGAPSVAHAEMDLPSPRFTRPPEAFGETAKLTCTDHTRPGVRAMGNLINDASGYGVHVEPRDCNGGKATSHHHSGRALDVMIDVRRRASRKDGNTLLRWLFYNQGARLKRLGVVEIIWADHIWTTRMDSTHLDPRIPTWRDHASANCPGDGENVCHYNHIHFSLSRRGAAKNTTYWTAQR